MAYSFQLIEAKTLTTTSSSVTFTSIPQTYTDLLVKLSVKQDGANAGLFLRPNSSTTNLSHRKTYADSVSVSGDSGSIIFIFCNGNWSTSNTFTNTDVYIPNYTSSNQKSVSIDSVATSNTTSAGLSFLGFVAGLWSNTTNISSLEFVPEGGGASFISGSTFYLYGIKNS
jgi:hypothetical protein